MNEITCPVCGSSDVFKKEHNEIISESYGGSKQITLYTNYCNNCDTDFDEENDQIIQETIEELKAKAVVNILNDFIGNGFNLSSMERSLELPQRTLAKWKSTGKPSAAGVSLLKILRCFPWILEVAEQEFEFQSAQKVFVKNAFYFIANNSSYMDPFYSNEPKASRPLVFNYNQQSTTNYTLIVGGEHSLKQKDTFTKSPALTFES